MSFTFDFPELHFAAKSEKCQAAPPREISGIGFEKSLIQITPRVGFLYLKFIVFGRHFSATKQTVHVYMYGIHVARVASIPSL